MTSPLFPAGSPVERVDVLGVGFGPSNMALAIAIEELNASRPADDRLSAVFLEKQATATWHPHMLFEDATMQVAFAKDLVTFRNPQSRFGYLSFLVAQGRIADFFNRGSMLPLRTEFVAYLQWAAAQLHEFVRYSCTVVSLEPVTCAATGQVLGFDVEVETQTGARRYRARDVVLAAGLQPVLPLGVEPGPRVWHTAEYLRRAAGLPADQPLQLAVVGGGQSAAEAVLHLHATQPASTIHCIHSGYGYVTSDMTPYANRVFDPSAVDDFFYAPSPQRRALHARHLTTNYSCVNPTTIDRIFDVDYQDRLAGRERLVWHKAATVTALHELRDAAELRVFEQLTGVESVLRVDVAVCGTGYRALDPTALLGGHAGVVQRDEDCRPLVNRDYSAVLTPEGPARLFLVGQTDHTHGISSTLLSNVAVRAGEILAALLEARETAPAGDGPVLQAAP